MGKLKWVTESVSSSCQDPLTSPKASVLFSVSFSCYPFLLTPFGAAEYAMSPHGLRPWQAGSCTAYGRANLSCLASRLPGQATNIHHKQAYNEGAPNRGHLKVSASIRLTLCIYIYIERER